MSSTAGASPLMRPASWCIRASTFVHAEDACGAARGTSAAVSVSGQEICRLAEEAAEASDPEVALETLTRLRRELDEFERQQVARALTVGRSFGEIARRLGVSRQAVHRRFKDLRRRRGAVSGLPPTPEVRLVVEYAGAEGEALDARALAPAHLLLGILRNGDRHAAAALTAVGVSLDGAREAVREAGDGPGAGDESLRAVLGAAVQVARRAGKERIEV